MKMENQKIGVVHKKENENPKRINAIGSNGIVTTVENIEELQEHRESERESK